MAVSVFGLTPALLLSDHGQVPCRTLSLVSYS
jgi:hypothetical protein